MSYSTLALAAWLRDVLLLREGMPISRAVAEERSRNIAQQLGEVLAATRCTRCGAQGTVDGDQCAACYLAPQPQRVTTGPEFSDAADAAAEETLPVADGDGSGSVRA